MVIGAQFVYGSAVSFNTVDGFDLTTNTWDPQGTWPDNVGGFGKSVDPGTGDVWTTNDLSVLRWSASTHQQVQLMSFNNTYLAMQSAWDPVRGQLVSIGFGDGWGYGNRDELHAYLVNHQGSLTPLTFTPSPALTQFLADRPVSCALEYDPDLDRYYVFDNQGDGPNGPADDGGRVYVITPNATATWDIAILPLGTGTHNPPKGPGTGVWNRLRYVPRLKGLVYLAAPSWDSAPDLYFLRTQ